MTSDLDSRNERLLLITVVDVVSGEEKFAPRGCWFDFAVSPTEPVIWTVGTDEIETGPSDLRLVTNPIQGYLWNYETQHLVHSPVPSHGMGIRFSTRGKLSAISHSRDPLNYNAKVDTHLFDVATGEIVSTLPGINFGAQINYPNAVSFSSDETYVAGPVQRGSRTVAVWDVATGERLADYDRHARRVSAIAFHPRSDDILISTSMDKTLQYWNWRESRTIKRMVGQRGKITTLAIGDTGEPVVTGGYDGSMCLWPPHDLSPGNQIAYASKNSSVPTYSSKGTYLAIGERVPHESPRNHSLLAAHYPQPMKTRRSVFTTENRERLWEIPGTELPLGFSPDERVLFTVTTNHILSRNTRTGADIGSVTLDRPLAGLDTDRPVPRLFDLSSDGSTMVAFNDDQTIRTIATATGTTTATFEQACAPNSVSFCPSGQKIIFRTIDGMRTGIWDPVTKSVIWLNTIPDARVTDARVASPNEKLVAGICSDRKVRVWEMATGDVIQSIEGAEPRDLAFTPDSRTLIVLDNDTAGSSQRLTNSLKLFDTRTWRQIANLRPPDYSRWIEDPILSPDGLRLMINYSKKNIRLIRIPTIEEIEESIRLDPAP